MWSQNESDENEIENEYETILNCLAVAAVWSLLHVLKALFKRFLEQLNCSEAFHKLPGNKMSSSDSDEEDWTFYKDRDEWKDVTPIKQDDGPNPVVALAYSNKCKYIRFT